MYFLDEYAILTENSSEKYINFAIDEPILRLEYNEIHWRDLIFSSDILRQNIRSFAKERKKMQF